MKLSEFIELLVKSGATLDSEVKVQVGTEDSKVPATDVKCDEESEVVVIAS